MAADLFGIDRESTILSSGIRDIFTPHAPISNRELFFGRQDEVRRLLECISTPGLHAVLYGERGVGKSSLANIASDVLLSTVAGGRMVKIRCDSSTTFPTICELALDEFAIPHGSVTRTESRTEGGSGGVTSPILSGQLHTSTTNTESREARPLPLTPRAVAAAIKDKRGLVVIDEFDAIREVSDRHSVAELIKQLSDESAPLKLLVVGIGASCADLLAGHASVQRNIREVRLPHMSDMEIREIVERNAARAHLQFAAQAVARIVELSAGYPHFTHLLGLYAAEQAIASRRSDVRATDLDAAMVEAMKNAEARLRNTYEGAVRSASTPMYAHVVHAAASIPGVEITAKALRAALRSRLGREVNQAEVNNYLGHLVSTDGSLILQRLKKGVYRFSDPRMKSYVRIAGEGASRPSIGPVAD